MSADPRLPKNPFSLPQRVTYNFFQVLDHFISRRITIKLLGRLRYKAFLSAAESLKSKGEGRLIEVERRENLTEDEFKKYYVKNGIPVVLKGEANNWDCVRKWSPQYFKKVHGTDQVPVIDSTDLDKEIDYISLADLIDAIDQGNNKAYFRFYNLLVQHPEHLEDFDINWLRSFRHKRQYFESFQVFIGGANSMTDIHNAHIANLFVQSYGRKEWVLYPNHYIPFIDPPSTENGIFRNAPARVNGKAFNPFQPDYEAYPYFKYLNGYTTVLEPGDILYNPPFMWHAVRNLTDSIGVGFRWVNAWHSLKSSPVYYLLDLMAYRPNYFKSIRMVRENANKQFIHRLEKMRKNANRKK